MTLPKPIAAKLEFKIAQVWIVLFVINSITTTFVAVSAGCVWANLGIQERWTVVAAGIANLTGTLMVYAASAMKKVAQGEFPLPIDETPKPSEVKPT
jgi:hypothetical protein